MAPDSPLSSYDSPDICYFSLPVPHSNFHFSDETPIGTPLLGPETPADPTHPLLARRETPPPLNSRLITMDASKLLQLQTAAAYSAKTIRPAASSSSSNSSSSSSSSSSNSSTTSISSSPSQTSSCYMRCVRCQRAAYNSSDPAKNGMIAFGTNLFYCVRCAEIVGYVT